MLDIRFLDTPHRCFIIVAGGVVTNPHSLQMRVSSALRVLGLDPRQGFDLDLVNRAYRIKSLQLHPDKNPDKPDANAQFQKVSRMNVSMLI